MNLLEQSLVRTGRNDDYDEKWGRFPTHLRFNVDQISISFVVDTKRTYEQVQQKHTEKI